MAGLEWASLVRVPFGPRPAARGRGRASRVLGAAPDRLPPSDRGARGGAPRRSWSSSPLGGARVLLDAPHAASRWCCRREPGPAAPAARCAPRPSCGPRSCPPGGGAEGGERLGEAGAVLDALSKRRDVRAGSGSGRWGDGRHLAPAGPSVGSSATRDSSVATGLPPRPVSTPVEPPQLPPSSGPRSMPSSRRSTREADRSTRLASSSSTGSPGRCKTEVYLAAVEAALARGRGRSSSSPRSAFAPQAVAASAPARRPLRRPPQRPLRRRTLREWQRLRRGERRSASPGSPSSPRFATSA